MKAKLLRCAFDEKILLFFFVKVPVLITTYKYNVKEITVAPHHVENK